jgi:hypothetical protein
MSEAPQWLVSTLIIAIYVLPFGAAFFAIGAAPLGLLSVLMRLVRAGSSATLWRRYVHWFAIGTAVICAPILGGWAWALLVAMLAVGAFVAAMHALGLAADRALLWWGSALVVGLHAAAHASAPGLDAGLSASGLAVIAFSMVPLAVLAVPALRARAVRELSSSALALVAALATAWPLTYLAALRGTSSGAMWEPWFIVVVGTRDLGALLVRQLCRDSLTRHARRRYWLEQLGGLAAACAASAWVPIFALGHDVPTAAAISLVVAGAAALGRGLLRGPDPGRELEGSDPMSGWSHELREGLGGLVLAAPVAFILARLVRI